MLEQFKGNSRYKFVSGVYRIHHESSGMDYVGSSSNIYQRMVKHVSKLSTGKHENRRLQAIYDEYGKESFHMEILEKYPPELVHEAESRWKEVFATTDIAGDKVPTPLVIGRGNRPISMSKARTRAFDARIVKGDDPGSCWTMSGRHKKGRPVMKDESSAARYSYARYRGIDPGPLLVLHTCDNSECVNPDHLYLGTQKRNMRDASNRFRCSDTTEYEVRDIRRKYNEGVPLRLLKAEYGPRIQNIAYNNSFHDPEYTPIRRRPRKHHWSKTDKMNIEKAREVRLRHADGIGSAQLAKDFGVTQSLICNIVSYRCWKEVDLAA